MKRWFLDKRPLMRRVQRWARWLPAPPVLSEAGTPPHGSLPPSAAALPAVRCVIRYICDVMRHMTCKWCGLIRDLCWAPSPWDGGGASTTGGIKRLTSCNGSSGIVHSSLNHTWTANCPLWKAVIYTCGCVKNTRWLVAFRGPGNCRSFLCTFPGC